MPQISWGKSRAGAETPSSDALSPCPPQGRGFAQHQGLGISEGLLRPAECPGEGSETPRDTELQPQVAF